MVGTKVGRTKHLRIMPGGALETEQSLASTGPSSVFVGKKLDEHRGSFILEYPMEKGHIVNGGWDAMEALWEVRLYHVHVCNYKIFFTAAFVLNLFMFYYYYKFTSSIFIPNQTSMLKLKITLFC